MGDRENSSKVLIMKDKTGQRLLAITIISWGICLIIIGALFFYKGCKEMEPPNGNAQFWERNNEKS